MSDIEHFPTFSIVDGGFRCEISLDRFSKQFEEAQAQLGQMVLASCRSFMPLNTSSQRDRSNVQQNGRVVEFPGPYARYLYMGKKMVDRETGKGPRKIPDGTGGFVWRYRKGAKLVATATPLNISKTSNPKATDHWFDAAKTADGEKWIAEVKRIAGGGKVE